MMTVFLFCAVVLTVSAVVATVFIVRTMIQVKRTAAEAETLLKSVNYEATRVKTFTENVAGFIEGTLNSPWLKFGTMASCIVSSVVSGIKRGRQKTQAEN